MPFWWPCKRANLIAPSLASAPELQKKTLSMPASLHNLAAAVSWLGISYRLEVCTKRVACSVNAWVTAGCVWPRPQTAIPATASKYLLPWVSVNQAPLPSTKATGKRP